LRTAGPARPTSQTRCASSSRPRSAQRPSSCCTAPTRIADVNLGRTLNADKTNAAKQCAAERADAAFPSTHGGKTFAQFYGTGKQGSNALGKCVSSKAKALDQQQQQATINAAKTCKAERTKLGPTEFTKNYGGHSNAFGKCVSKTAHANP
jgi:hypothetical protein